MDLYNKIRRLEHKLPELHGARLERTQNKIKRLVEQLDTATYAIYQSNVEARFKSVYRTELF